LQETSPDLRHTLSNDLNNNNHSYYENSDNSSSNNEQHEHGIVNLSGTFNDSSMNLSYQQQQQQHKKKDPLVSCCLDAVT